MVKNFFISTTEEERKAAFNRLWKEYIERMESKK